MRSTLAEQPTGNKVVETEAIWVSELVRAAFDFGDCYLSSIAKSSRRGHAVIAGKRSGRRQGVYEVLSQGSMGNYGTLQAWKGAARCESCLAAV